MGPADLDQREDAEGERAIGTLVSAEVYDRVLVDGLAWTDRAFVVNDWYVTAYEPIRDVKGKIIGMLEAPYAEMRGQVVWAIIRYSSLSLALALGLAFLLGRRITKMAESLQRTLEEKDQANRRLQELNLRYLELLGFATHELMYASEAGALEGERWRRCSGISTH